MSHVRPRERSRRRAAAAAARGLTVALRSRGERIASGTEIYVFDTGTGVEIARLTLGGRPRTIAFQPDGSRAYVPAETGAAVRVLDTRTHAPVDTIHLPAGSRPMDTSVSRDGTRLLVALVKPESDLWLVGR